MVKLTQKEKMTLKQWSINIMTMLQEFQSCNTREDALNVMNKIDSVEEEDWFKKFDKLTDLCIESKNN